MIVLEDYISFLGRNTVCLDGNLSEKVEQFYCLRFRLIRSHVFTSQQLYLEPQLYCVIADCG